MSLRSLRWLAVPTTALIAAAPSWGANGFVAAWGKNTDGQTTLPGDLGKVTQVDGGDAFTIALRADGTVRVWGGNAQGQGDVPPDVTAAIWVAAGAQHALAIRDDGTVRAWGDNADGQCDVPGDLGSATAVSAACFAATAASRSLASTPISASIAAAA